MTLKVLELFGGIGAPRSALERLGVDFEIVDYVEIDKFAVNSYNAIYDSNYDPQDISEWDKDVEVDIIFHGSPCQDFSIAGQQAGGEEDSGTRSSLLWETVRIVNKLKPKYVIWENVKNVISKKHKHTFDNYISEMATLGYTTYYEVLNAKHYGIPQNRERVFAVSILGDHEIYEYPQKQELTTLLKNVLEDSVDDKYFISQKMEKAIMGNAIDTELRDHMNRGNMKFNKSVAYTINTKPDRRVGDSNYITLDHEEVSVSEYLAIKNATKKGYLEAGDGDGVDLAYPNSKLRRGRVQLGMSQTITTDDSKAVVVKTPTARPDTMGIVIKDVYPEHSLRIRKLTPKECWRLMGFDDTQFDKAQQVNSNAQLYKQAGNSIVVNVLVELIKPLCENWFVDEFLKS